ncbi:MAG: hypothetical protein ACI8YI_001426, partial [Paracoccaceae bacterium]
VVVAVIRAFDQQRFQPAPPKSSFVCIFYVTPDKKGIRHFGVIIPVAKLIKS